MCNNGRDSRLTDGSQRRGFVSRPGRGGSKGKYGHLGVQVRKKKEDGNGQFRFTSTVLNFGFGLFFTWNVNLTIFSGYFQWVK